jgi:hypothetical protein
MRRHADRLTGADKRFEEAADAMSTRPPETSHLIAAELPDDSAEAHWLVGTLTVTAPMSLCARTSRTFDTRRQR